MARGRRGRRRRPAGPGPGRVPAHGVRRAARRLLSTDRLHSLRVLANAVDLALYKQIRSVARTPATVAWVRRYSALGEHGLVWHGLAASGMLLDRRRARQWAGCSVRVLLGTCASVAIKRAIGRQRPAVEDLPHLMATPTGLSFPSSHSTTSFAAAQAFRRLVPGPVLYGAAIVMAVSRLYLGVHYPSDIAAGAALGTVIGR